MKNSFPKIMSIINSTPDSFSDGGNYDINQLTEKALKEIEDGADIIDIGGESTRPGALPISKDEEINRTIPLIQNIRKYNKNDGFIFFCLGFNLFLWEYF